MKEYRIRMLDEKPADWSGIAKAEINEYVWGKDYMPVCYAQVVFVKGDGFYARMTCEEKNPKAVYTEFMSGVCRDSCLEFFASYDASKPDYVNVEMNSIGTSLIAVGPDRYHRTDIDRFVGGPFEVEAKIEENCWHVCARITLTDLEKIYGLKPETFSAGYAFRGNFYKCGDDTEIVHYGMWNPVGTENPDFHRPEYFGKLILEA